MLWQDREARPEHRGDEKEAFIGLCLLINSACAGRLCPSVMALWSMCRAALLPKPDGGGWRPLGIGDGWYRVMGKVVAKALAEGVGADMAPLQLAVGLKHGVEIGARSAQVVYNLINDHPTLGFEDLAIIKLDVKNAFNSLPRAHMFDAIMDRCPSVARLFRSPYGEPSKLFLSSGVLVGESQTGVRQGCPLAMIFFCLGIQPMLQRLESEVLSIRDGSNSPLPAGVVAYADDIYAYISDLALAPAVAACSHIVGSTTMTLKPSSCEVLVQPGRIAAVPCEPLAAAGFNVTDVGIKVLGNPVGTEGYRRTELRRKIETMWRPLPALAHIHPQSAFILLKECVDARPCYLERVAEPELMWEALEEFDSRMDTAIACIARTTVDPHLPVIRSLPSDLGGLGLTRHAGQRSAAQCKSSREAVSQHIKAHPSRDDLIDGMAAWGPIAPRYHRDYVDGEEGPPRAGEDAAPLGNNGTGIFGGTRGGRQWRRWQELYRRLLGDGREHHAAWHEVEGRIGPPLRAQGGLLH